MENRNTINLNESVWVELTDHGRAVLAKHVEDIGMPMPHMTSKGEGRKRWQLWDLAHVFGPALYCGAHPVFVSNTLDRVTTEAVRAAVFVDTSTPKTEAYIERMAHERPTFVEIPAGELRLGDVLEPGQTVSILRRPEPSTTVSEAIAAGPADQNTGPRAQVVPRGWGGPCEPTPGSVPLGETGLMPMGETEEVRSLRGSLALILGGFHDRHHDVFRAGALAFVRQMRDGDGTHRHTVPRGQVGNGARARVDRDTMLAAACRASGRETMNVGEACDWLKELGPRVDVEALRAIASSLDAPGTHQDAHAIRVLIAEGFTPPTGPADPPSVTFGHDTVTIFANSRGIQLPVDTPRPVIQALFAIAEALDLAPDTVWPIEDLAEQVKVRQP